MTQIGVLTPALVIFATILLSTPAWAETQANPSDDMIEIDRAGWIATPYLDSQTGERLHAIPVVARERGNGETILETYWGSILTGSLRASIPQIVSGSLGIILGRVECPDVTLEDRPVCQVIGALIQLEPGMAGQKASIGFAMLNHEYNSDWVIPWLPRIATKYQSAFDLKVTAVHMIGFQYNLISADYTYVGVDMDFMVKTYKYTLGVLKKIAGNPMGGDLIVTSGFGIGF